MTSLEKSEVWLRIHPNLLSKTFICVPQLTWISQFILRTDENGHRWEIRILTDGTTEYRREGLTSWMDDLPRWCQNSLTRPDP